VRILIQRVKRASVEVEGRKVSEIGEGLLLFVGICKDDAIQDIEYLSKKVVNLRIFEDVDGKMNLNIKQVSGQILSVPQFTLYADTAKGNRPGFDRTAGPEKAKDYWMRFNDFLRRESIGVSDGIFAAHMAVALLNDGPVTIWLDSINR
jgi:D-tyrosyl-tRNA(Tyr) deacylase